MSPDTPHALASILILSELAVVMLLLGLRSRALEVRHRKRRCPSCGRVLKGRERCNCGTWTAAG